MANQTNIKAELLKQMDNSSHVEAKSAHRTIERDMARVRRLRWITVTSWVVTVLYFAAMSILKDVLAVDINHFLTQEELFIFYSDMGLKVLFVIAVLLTGTMYLKSRTLTIKQICARLANIEEQLRRLSEDKSATS